MNISSIFKDERENGQRIVDVIKEKTDQISGNVNAVTNLQEIFSTLMSVQGGSGILQTLSSDHQEFDIKEWEKNMVGKLKNAHYGAAKTVMGIMTNKEKFIEMSTQTCGDPMKTLYDEIRDNYERLALDFRRQKETLDHTSKKVMQMKLTHDEERKRWAARDIEHKKVEYENKELKNKYKLSKDFELQFKKKISKLNKVIEKRNEAMVKMEIEQNNKISLLESDEYVIKRLEKCIKDTRDGNGKFSKDNSLYNSFMKMNIGGSPTSERFHSNSAKSSSLKSLTKGKGIKKGNAKGTIKLKNMSKNGSQNSGMSSRKRRGIGSQESDSGDKTGKYRNISRKDSDE